MRYVFGGGASVELVSIEQSALAQPRKAGVSSKSGVGSRIRTATTPRQGRDAVILALGIVLGLRRAELANVAREDIDLAEARLRVRGKGGRLRVLPVPTAVRRLLESWLAQFPAEARYIFPPISKAGVIKPGRVGPFGIAKIVGRLCCHAGVRDLTPHDLRRTAITTWLAEGGADIVTAAKLSGHKSPAMVALYDRRDESRQVATLERVVIPTSGST